MKIANKFYLIFSLIILLIIDKMTKHGGKKVRAKGAYVKGIECGESSNIYSMDLGIGIKDENDDFIGP